MLLNNFRRMLVNTLCDVGSIATSDFSGMTNDIVKTSGNILQLRLEYRDEPTFSSWKYIYDCPIEAYEGDYTPVSNMPILTTGVVLGDGDTPPTVDDYKLSGNFIDGLTHQSILTKVNNTSFVLSCLKTNNTESPITIKEIALCSFNSGASSRICILFTRDVLPEPVILNAGDSKIFSVTIDFRSLTDSTINV